MNAENRIAELEKQVEELTDKHWEECRQIALYDDELKTNGEPVRHGRWYMELSVNAPKYMECSVCRYDFDRTYIYNFKFCPNCGAKMDGGENDETDV